MSSGTTQSVLLNCKVIEKVVLVIKHWLSFLPLKCVCWLIRGLARVTSSLPPGAQFSVFCLFSDWSVS